MGVLINLVDAEEYLVIEVEDLRTPKELDDARDYYLVVEVVELTTILIIDQASITSEPTKTIIK